MRSLDDRHACDPERLAELARRGGGEALDQMTRCYGARLLRAGRRHCRTAEEAEDAVQAAWLVAATDLGDFRAEGSLEGWLVRIVASACRRISDRALLALRPEDRLILLLAEVEGRTAKKSPRRSDCRTPPSARGSPASTRGSKTPSPRF